MKTLCAIVIFVVLATLSTVAYTDQVAVNIVYPINGEAYPAGDLECKVDFYYQPASFSVTCKGCHGVKWGMDDKTLGSATFCDQISVQFIWGLAPGEHKFWVDSDCGGNGVGFKIR